MTPTYLIGVILPLVTGFYLLLSVLEDSGYLPRIAALADRSLTSVGLNGRAIIPLILGLGCVTMGTLTTRILGTQARALHRHRAHGHRRAVLGADRGHRRR